MLFQKAIEPLTLVIQKEIGEYLGPSWVEERLEMFFNGQRKRDKTDEVIANFISENCVEAPTTEVLRLSIMQYTFGYFVRDIVYANRFRNNLERCKAYKGEHTKLLFANSLIQWKLMCEQLGYDWDEMLALGQEHLEERYKDFMKDGWAKL